MTLPEYINCKSEVISHCDYYMHSDCKETCAYALDINGMIENVGIGGMTEWDFDPDSGCAYKKQDKFKKDKE